MRDPRLDPIAGDVIRQNQSGLLVKVKDYNDEGVCFYEIKKRSQPQPTTWSIKGWRNVVAYDSTVVERGDA